MTDDKPKYVDLISSNIECEHICCAIAGKEHQEGVDRKKAFLCSGFDQGLVFRKLGVRGKVFIEYAPAEAAWRPVLAPGYLVIHCLWVSGRYKGQQLGRELLQHCLDDAGARHHGVVAVSGRSPYLTDTRFYLHHGFELVERTDTGCDLVGFRDGTAPTPRFADNARRGTVPEAEGVHFEYAYQCPFIPGCLRDMAAVAREFDLVVTSRELTTVEEARDAASPFGTFGAFLHGKLVTHELMSGNKFRKLLEDELRAT
ncbi:GNAT family N-acetyltransferase [Gemmatimonadota bacterium]